MMIFSPSEVFFLPAKEPKAASKRRPSRTKRRRTPWNSAELMTFGLAFLIFLSMTGSGFALVLHTYRDYQQGKLDAANNKPKYITYFRDVILSSDEKDEPESLTVPDSELEVDLAQFEGKTGYAGTLYELRKEYPQAASILHWYENAECTVNDTQTTVGEADPDHAIPERLLKMACDNHETMDFVAAYPQLHNAAPESAVEQVSTSDVPLYLQWDSRWGYEEYGDGLIGYTGCAPTCMAMAVSYFTESTVTPDEVCRFANGNGYYINGTGTDWKFIVEGAEHYGLHAVSMDSVDEQRLTNALNDGSLVICTMSPGDFTLTGHFILITGREQDGFTLNDPNSPLRSEKKWSYDTLGKQFRHLWVLSADK